MTTFTIHALSDAADDRKKVLEKAQNTMGMVPNMIGGLAESPQAAEAYMALSHFFVKSSLTPAQRHVVWLTVNAEHNCEYCMAGHTAIATMEKMDASLIESARNLTEYEDPSLEALKKFTLSMIRKRGWLDEQEVDEFIAAGYTKQNVFDVLLGVAHKTISNYANHLIKTPVDDFAKSFAWEKPTA